MGLQLSAGTLSMYATWLKDFFSGVLKICRWNLPPLILLKAFYVCVLHSISLVCIFSSLYFQLVENIKHRIQQYFPSI